MHHLLSNSAAFLGVKVRGPVVFKSPGRGLDFDSVRSLAGE